MTSRFGFFFTPVVILSLRIVAANSLTDFLVLDAFTGFPMLPNHFTMNTILATRALEKIAGRAIIKVFRWFSQYDIFPIREHLPLIGGDCQAKSPHGHGNVKVNSN